MNDKDMDVITAKGIIVKEKDNNDVFIIELEGTMFLLNDSETLFNVTKSDCTNLTQFVLDSIENDIKEIVIKRVYLPSAVDVVNPFKVKRSWNENKGSVVIVIDTDDRELLRDMFNKCFDTTESNMNNVYTEIYLKRYVSNK